MRNYFITFRFVFKSSKIATSVFIMERILNSNTNQTKQAIYRGLIPLMAKEESKFNRHYQKNMIYSSSIVKKRGKYGFKMIVRLLAEDPHQSFFFWR
jgi:hypothetical protein